MGSSEDPSLVNNVDELGLVHEGLNVALSEVRVICLHCTPIQVDVYSHE